MALRIDGMTEGVAILLTGGTFGSSDTFSLPLFELDFALDESIVNELGYSHSKIELSDNFNASRSSLPGIMKATQGSCSGWIRSRYYGIELKLQVSTLGQDIRRDTPRYYFSHPGTCNISRIPREACEKAGSTASTLD